MKYYIDRIEEGLAVMDSDDGERMTVPVEKLPHGIRDGSVVIRMSDGTFVRDEAEEAERRKTMSSRFERLKNRNGGK